MPIEPKGKAKEFNWRFEKDKEFQRRLEKQQEFTLKEQELQFKKEALQQTAKNVKVLGDKSK